MALYTTAAFQKLYQLEQKRAKLLVDSAALTANGKKELELKAVNDELEKTNTQMKELYENIKNVLSEKQKLQLTNMDSEAQFKASRKTFNGADNTAQELKKQQKATEDDLKRTIKQQESIYENRRKQIQALENYAKNNSNYKNSNIQTYLYGEDGTGNTSGKIKELREQLSLIENLRASKTDAEAFGVSVDDMASSVSELRSELKSLTGVDIMKDAAGTEFKSTYQILKEISAVWDKLTDVSKANVTEMLGGKRNSNAVLSVIEQFSIAEKSMEDAANSSNSAMTEQERMMDSIEGRLKQLNASFEKFSNDVMSSDLIKFFVTLATKTVDAADGMVNLAGSIPAITAAISGVLSVMQMSGKLKNGAGKVNMPSYICCV